jgi:flagellar basal body-associated protein FliL
MKKINKKGSIVDIFYIVLVMFIISIVFVIGWVIFSRVNTEFQSHSDLSTEGKAIMQSSTDKYVRTFDNLFLTVGIALYIGAMILAWNVDISPVFFFLSIVIFAVLVILAGVYGNAFYTFSENAQITTYASDFNIIPLVMNNFVEIFVVLGFGLAGVMYAKTR